MKSHEYCICIQDLNENQVEEIARLVDGKIVEETFSTPSEDFEMKVLRVPNFTGNLVALERRMSELAEKIPPGIAFSIRVDPVAMPGYTFAVIIRPAVSNGQRSETWQFWDNDLDKSHLHRLTGPAYRFPGQYDTWVLRGIITKSPFGHLQGECPREIVVNYLKEDEKHYPVVLTLHEEGILELDPEFLENIRFGSVC